MDLELTDEQTWLAESIDTLLRREWPGAERAHEAGRDERASCGARWSSSAPSPSTARTASAPWSCACWHARSARTWRPSRSRTAPRCGSRSSRTSARRQTPSPTWATTASPSRCSSRGAAGPWTGCGRSPARMASPAARRPSSTPERSDRLAVVALVDGEPGLVLRSRDGRGPRPSRQQPRSTRRVPRSTVTLTGVDVTGAPAVGGDLGRRVLARLTAVGGLLAAAESWAPPAGCSRRARSTPPSAASSGGTIGSNQALRHLLADMYVRTASSWSTVLYAAAALDDDIEDAEQTAAIAKAYVARAAREVAHGALQVFGGIAFTEEHQAHRFLRRIVVREQQFGDARHHERAIGRALAARTSERAAVSMPASVS